MAEQSPTTLNVVVFSCVYGKYECRLREHCIKSSDTMFLNIRYVCFTDDVDRLKQQSVGWELVHFEPCTEWCKDEHPAHRTMHNVVLCRCNPARLPGLESADVCVYLDAHLQILDPFLIANLLTVTKSLERPLLVLLKADNRTCAFDEAQISMRIKKYNNTDLERQVQTYKNAGMPSHIGLFSNAFIVYLHPHCPLMQQFYDMYSDEMVSYAKNNDEPYHAQGQVSLPYVLWRLNWLPSILTTNDQKSLLTKAPERIVRLVVTPTAKINVYRHNS